MALRLKFEGIRCFSEPQEAVIRPLTLLVGENSSGKTTFLAICQLAQAIAQGRATDLPFNRPPFNLGAYDQIASFRPVNGGRARRFSIAIGTGADEGAEVVSVLESLRGQPSMTQWRLSDGKCSFSVETAGQPDDLAGVVLEVAGVRKRVLASQMSLAAWIGIWASPEFLDLAGTAWELFDPAATASATSLHAAFRALREEFSSRPYAFAPIRTSPQRTYDPVIAEPKPEGPHVPMLLAAMARSKAKQPWKKLQSALKRFGTRSGLFDGIEIVNKGKKESDPFQVGVKSGGPSFNLIDVGYGVSQALPILVDTLLRSGNGAFFLLQQPEVHLHPRAQAELGTFLATQAGTDRRFVIETHSDYLVDRIRMEVRQGSIKSSDVSLLYFERYERGARIHNLELDDNGTIVDPPPGYRQFFLDEERDLLGL